MSVIKKSVTIGNREISIETGKMARQAGGAVVIGCGGSRVLVTATGSKAERDMDFLPLTCEYKEKSYAAGRIPGSFFRREGRPSTDEILVCRLMDRPIRPLFPKNWRCESQLIANVIGFDGENQVDVLAMIGTSAALHISDLPWEGPIAGIRIGRVDGTLIAYPTVEEQKNSDIDMIVAASKDAIMMVEGGMEEVSEADIIDALMFAHKSVQPLIALQEELRASHGKPKRQAAPIVTDAEIEKAVSSLDEGRLATAMATKDKHLRNDGISALKKEITTTLCGPGGAFEGRDKEVSDAFSKKHKKEARVGTITTKSRMDGRAFNEIRQISCEVGLLPTVHGSALFTRGETQALVAATMGTKYDEQRMDSLLGDKTKTFYLHYNFPPFCTGEAKMIRSTSRREIGHGHLAERSVEQIMPAHSDFPYTTRVVSEILESNGSSSMASVCGASLALMDAGVPTSAPVAGIAMGLMKEGDDYAILSDILGDEDHLGDMDFKVTGTAKGVCALQMDIKISGLPREILEKALEQARQGRLHILGCMKEAIETPRTELSPYAPRIESFQVSSEKIRDIIGPGGKTIRAIVEQTGAKVDIDDAGIVTIASPNQKSLDQARDLVTGLTREAEAGAYYTGIVKRVVEFGAFVEILPGTDGLLHISEIADERIRNVTDVVDEGDEVVVKCLSVERDGKIRLSRKAAQSIGSEEQVYNFVA